MTDDREHAVLLSRRALGTMVALGALGVGGCADSTWLIRRELAPFKLPPRIPIMVFLSPRIREVDQDGYTNVVTTALESELSQRGIHTEVMDLAGAPRLPRIEIAFYALDLGGGGGANGVGVLASITVDCAFVSARDEVAFIGRVRSPSTSQRLALGAEAAGRAIAKTLMGD